MHFGTIFYHKACLFLKSDIIWAQTTFYRHPVKPPTIPQACHLSYYWHRLTFKGKINCLHVTYFKKSPKSWKSKTSRYLFKSIIWWVDGWRLVFQNSSIMILEKKILKVQKIPQKSCWFSDLRKIENVRDINHKNDLHRDLFDSYFMHTSLIF